MSESSTTVTHVATARDTLYAKRADGSTWRWWRGGERWERVYESLPCGLEWVSV
jgi:hypothetical protein